MAWIGSSLCSDLNTPPWVPPPCPSHPNLWKIQATQSESQSVGTFPFCIKGKALKAQLWFISAHTLGCASAGLTGGDFTWTFFSPQKWWMKATVFRKGVFLSDRLCRWWPRAHSATWCWFSGARLTRRLPGVWEKRRNLKKGWGGGGGQVQSLKDLIATLTSRSKESLLGLWSLDNRV